MGFCILGGKENYLRKLLSEKLTSLGKTIGMGAAPAQYVEDIQEIYDERYTAGRSDGQCTILYIDWGSWTGDIDVWTPKTFDIRSRYPNYQSITANNIYSYFNRVSGTGGNNFYVRVKSYVASTGSLTLECNANFSNPQIAVIISP